MACRRVLLLAAVAAAAACLPAPASAREWMVGDAGGWRPQFNKTGWANGKTFRVGDTLMFMYLKGAHTVIRVGKDFAACNLQGNQLGAWYSGEDVVALDRPGKVWFLCSKPGHCDNGMKLAINVVEGGRAPAPAPAAPSAPPAPPAPAAPSPAPAPAAPAPSSAPLSYTVGSAVVIVAGAVVASVLAF